MHHQLENGKSDVAIGIMKTPDREKKLIFPKKPIGSFRPVLVVKKTHPLQKVASADDLLALKIGFYAKAPLVGFLNDPRLQFDLIYSIDWQTLNMKKLIGNRIDACVGDYHSMVFEAVKLGYSSKTRMIPLHFENSEIFFYVVFSPKTYKKYLDSYEAALERVQASHSFDEVFNAFIKNYNQP